MDETKTDMHVESEQKDNKIQFIEDKMGIPDFKGVDKMNRLGLGKISSRKKVKAER